MRLSVLAAPLLLAATTLARAPLKRGQTVDTCANLDADLVFSDVLVDGKPYDAGHIHIGLCISQVKTFVGHYNVTEAAAKVVGVDKVESTVTGMIKNAGVQCTYPPHAKPVTGSNECDFVCTDGFLAMPPNHPSSCTCPPYLMQCNDKCGHYHSDCTTTPPPSRRQNEPKCGKDLTMCGVPDATSGQAYKCTNVTSDSYTCGGCVKASPFGSPSIDGVNCRNIPSVDEVSCKDGKCFVHTCKSGFTPSASNDGCVAKPDEKTTRGFPMSRAGRVVDTATGHVYMVAREQFSEPRTDATSGLAHPILSGAKSSLSGARSNMHHNIPKGTKFPRESVPLKGHVTNMVAGVAKTGTHLDRDVADGEQR
ncbi:hypothetical protein J3R82DRAFT_1736 [Butyriboletus roseoflavus]|nr:hypothetical protein J3R82DRAFT_1736 [Butyriboletus roseoflavus]